MSRTPLESIILYGGGFLLVYYVLKSWGIIAAGSARTTTMGTTSKLQIDWKPLTQEQLDSLRAKIQEVNPYISDSIDARTGRGRISRYGFAGNTAQ